MMRQLDFFDLINKRWITKVELKDFLKCSEDECSNYLEILKDKTTKSGLNITNNKNPYIPIKVFMDYFNLNEERIIRYHNSLIEFGI